MNIEIIEKSVRKALIEDKARVDITSNFAIPVNHRCAAVITAKEAGVLCGTAFAKTVFRQMSRQLAVTLHAREGAALRPGMKIMTVKGNTRDILGAERTALNFLGYLSGIATLTARYVRAIRPQKAAILGTRKTTPGNRLLEKYAITIGGGETHRNDLSEMILLKDNHRSAYYKRGLTLKDAMEFINKQTRRKIEVEVDTLDELRLALACGADIILLDNMTTAQLRRAVSMTKKLPTRKRPLLEASGGVTLRNVGAIARSGVDRISIGALTHHNQWINFSMEI